MLHRASMKYYQNWLVTKGLTVEYVDHNNQLADAAKLVERLARNKVTTVHCQDVHDNWLEKKLMKACHRHNVKLVWHTTPGFINSKIEVSNFFIEKKKKFLQNDWYIKQRKQRNILLDNLQTPLGGQWSLDSENRSRYPKGKVAPKLIGAKENAYTDEAKAYVEKHFPKNPGEVTEFIYPVTHEESRKWFAQFLTDRFHEFGTYEDAIVQQEHFLHHSVLTPVLNIGLITPNTILQDALLHATTYQIPINSTEGFVRQILGWREFIQGIYSHRGSMQRTKNFWGFKRKIPSSFYIASTGILPLDTTIDKVLKTGYCHHIERLMILGNFMLLCEFDPDEVYRWFMEMFIDSYDWVMVPNVYGMSQFADGGLMATKPYISGSNYLMKMSDYKKGEWQAIWDALFWRFIYTHQDFFVRNPRLNMLVKTFLKMPESKKKMLLTTAEEYLRSLDR